MHGGPGGQDASENIIAAIGGILCCFLCSLGLVFCILLPSQYNAVRDEAYKLQSNVKSGRSDSCTLHKRPVRHRCTNTTICTQATQACDGARGHCVKTCHQWARGINCFCEVPLSVSNGGSVVAQLDLGVHTYEEVDGHKWCKEQIAKEEILPEIKILTDDGEWGCKSYAGKVPKSTDEVTQDEVEEFVRGDQPHCLESVRLGSRSMVANMSWLVQERYSMAAATGRGSGGCMLVGAGIFLGLACFAYDRGRGNRRRRSFRLGTSSSGLGSSGSDEEDARKLLPEGARM